MRNLKVAYHQLLARNIELFDLVESHSCQGVWLLDLKNTQHFWMNPRGAAFLGYSEVSLGDWISSLAPKSWETIKAFAASYQESQEHMLELDLQLLSKEVRVLHVHCILQVFSMEAGEPDLLIGIIEQVISPKDALKARFNPDLKRYHDAQHLAQLGHWEFNHQNQTLLWSDEVFRIHEVDKQNYEPTYKKLLACIHPEDLQTFERTFENALTNKVPFLLQHRLLLADGRIKYIDAHGETTYDAFGKPLKTIGTIQDITHIRKYEEEVYKSNSVFHNTLDLLCIAGYDGYFKVLNPAWERQLGWSIKELLQLPWDSFVHPDDVLKTKDITSVIVDGHEVFQFENRYRCKDGSYIWLSWNSYPYPAEEVMFGVARNITNQKHTEQALLEAHEKLMKLAAQVPGVVYQFQLFQNGRTCFPYASPGIRQIYDVSPEEVAEDATLVFERLHPNDRDRVTADIYESAEKLSLFHCEYRVILPGKEPEWRLSNARPERMPDGSTLWYGIITDITFQKAYEQKLHESEAQLTHSRDLMRYIINHNTSAVAVHDTNLNYVFVSQKYIQDFNLQGQEVIGRHHYELFPDLPQKWREIHQRALQGESLSSEEDYYVKEDGEMVWTRWDCRPWYEYDGSIGGIILYTEIITERKAVEEQLRTTSSYLANLLNYANAPIITWDAAFKITRFNHAFERLTGYQSEEVLGQNLSFLFPSQEINDSIAKVKTASEGNNWESVEIQVKRKDGAIRTALWNSANIYDQEGAKWVETIAQGQDITERMLAQDKLNAAFEELEILRNALDHVPIYVYMKDLQSKYTYANQLALKLFDLTPEQLSSVNDFDLFPPETAERLREIDLRVFKGEQTAEQISSKDSHGNHVHFLEIKSPIYKKNDHSKVVGMLGFSTDMTESVNHLKRIESLLQIEEEQNKRLRNFTHIVSHNLRSHTANMMGIFTLLELENSDLLEYEYIRMIKSAAENLTQTIAHLNQVLDINLTAKEKIVRVQLNGTIETAISSISLLAKNAGVEIIFKSTEEVFVDAVPAYMDSIVLNMLTNAIKFRAEDRPAFVKVSLEKRSQEIQMRFEDNGLGIDLARHGAKLFGMYKTFHGHKDSKGLGLFITKNHIEAMGGSISVESEVGKGTTFMINFPIQA
jgi:PAS domain S-box-containing protein